MAIQTNVVSNNVLDAMNPRKTGSSTTTGTSGTETAAAAQDRFMTLLVTQMKNQDPLNPLDNAEVTSQLAQLSTVTGIDKLNETVKGLQASYQASQSLQSAALIGHGVLTPGQGVALSESKALLGVEVTEPADNVTITIYDAAKNPVHTFDMGAQDIGITPLAWDGMKDSGELARDGQYSMQVVATRGGKQIEGAQPLSFGMVGSVSTNAQGVKVNLTGMGAVDLSAIKQIL